MPKKDPSQRLPKYCHHKATGQAYVTLNGHRHYLGAYDSPKSREAYDRLIAEWLANGRKSVALREDLRVVELVDLYLAHCDEYYRHANGEPTREITNIELALRPLTKLYSSLPAAEFGPAQLKAIQAAWIRDDLSRPTVNQRTGIIKRCFRWGTAESILDPAVCGALTVVSGLRKGRSKARETEPVRPVAEADFRAALGHMPRPVASLALLQWYTGARPGEVVNLRPCDIDQGGDVWSVTLSEHKNAHRAMKRTIYLGPEAQSVIRPFLLRPAETPLFSPREALQERYAARQTHRRTNQKANPKKTDRVVREQYDVRSYARAIATACRKAQIDTWAPNRLRHSFATRMRARHGIETARTLLGHTSIDMTAHYADVDEAKAKSAALESC